MKTIAFLGKVPISKTMVFEKLFHPNLALSYADKLEVIKEQSICVWLSYGNRLAGETYGMKLCDSVEEIEGTERYRKGHVLYMYSIAVLTPFQGLGLARMLKSYVIGAAKMKGFTRIIGHALEGPSIALSKSFGAKTVGRFHDWYGTGKIAYLYELKI